MTGYSLKLLLPAVTVPPSNGPVKYTWPEVLSAATRRPAVSLIVGVTL